VPATRATSTTAVREALGRRLELSTTVNVGTDVVSRSSAAGRVRPDLVAIEDAVVIGPLIDPSIWQSTVTLPNTGDKPARLVVREYERYYTDRTVPEVRAGATRRRRVVEERLVYTAVFEL